MQHPARKIDYDHLYDKLRLAVFSGEVKEQFGENGLRLYCYTDETVYSRLWHETTMLARGLILDIDKQEIVATPFPKFFNYQEVASLPEHIANDIGVSDFVTFPFDVFEKLDGSLIIIFYHNGKWQAATKGSFSSQQAQWAQGILDGADLGELLPGVTYLAEAIYPENRIVVNYGDFCGMKLLAAYDTHGTEFSYDTLTALAKSLGWGIAKRHSFETIQELLDNSDQLSCQEEGYIVRSKTSGQRIKIKGAEYCRVHRMISNLTPLAIWRALKEQEDLELFRRSLPEEFLPDFDDIKGILENHLNNLLAKIHILSSQLQHLSNKDIGLGLHELPEDLRPFIFSYRKYGAELAQNPKTRNGLFETFRPTRNVLPGYTPSSSVVRVQDDNE